MRTGITWIIAILELAVVWISNHYGGWYAIFVVAVANGIVISATWRALWTSWIAGVGGWALALTWQSLSLPILRTASLVTAIMGFGSHATIVLVLTLALPLLFATAAVWLGRAARGVFDVREERGMRRV